MSNNVTSTQLHGMRKQIESWIPVIADMPGFEVEDYNNLYELQCRLEDAIDEIFYALRELKDE